MKEKTMRFIKIGYWAGLFFCGSLGPGVVLAQEGDAEVAEVESPVESFLIAEGQTLERDEYYFGDWGGKRGQWADDGITFDVQWTQYFQGVTDGGVKGSERYGGKLDNLIEFDLGKMGVQEGAFVKVLVESRYGESVNDDVGTLYPANLGMSLPTTDELDDNIPVAITELSFTQFLSPSFGVLLGKLQTLDGDLNEFASGRGRSQFMNLNFSVNPVSTIVPYSTLGAGVVVLPTSKIMISSVLLNSSDSSTTTGFNDFGEGWTSATEAQFQYQLNGLPGGQSISFVYSADNEFLNLRRSGVFPEGVIVTTEDDTWAAYWSSWQYIYTLDEVPDKINLNDGKADLRGLGYFARFGVADEDTSAIEWSLSAGLGGRGLISGREDDSFGVGFGYTDINSDVLTGELGLDDDAYGLEAYYNFSLGRGVELTLDGQVINPASKETDTATILGARLNMRF